MSTHEISESPTETLARTWLQDAEIIAHHKGRPAWMDMVASIGNLAFGGSEYALQTVAEMQNLRDAFNKSAYRMGAARNVDILEFQLATLAIGHSLFQSQ